MTIWFQLGLGANKKQNLRLLLRLPLYDFPTCYYKQSLKSMTLLYFIVNEARIYEIVTSVKGEMSLLTTPQLFRDIFRFIFCYWHFYVFFLLHHLSDYC